MTKLFVAEDDPGVLSLYKALFDGTHDVLMVSSLREALSKVDEARRLGVTIAFLDGNLGTSEHDGEDVAAALRSAIPDIKIVSLSARERTWGDVNLEKPFPIQKLLELAASA